MTEDIAGRIQRNEYGLSDKLNAPENQNRELPDRYRVGVLGEGESKPLTI